MHTLTLVLLPPDTVNLWQAGEKLLRPFQMIDDERKPDTRLDYWTVGGGNIRDELSAVQLAVAANRDLASNVCFVSRLPVDFIPGAIVTPDGKWHDLSDFGWKLIKGDSQDNRDTKIFWANEVGMLFAAHKDCIAVEFDTHI
jgi:hypothetical protein